MTKYNGESEELRPILGPKKYKKKMQTGNVNFQVHISGIFTQTYGGNKQPYQFLKTTGCS